MTDDIMGLVDRLQQVAPLLDELLTGTPSAAAEPGTGTDGSGTVHVILDRAGLPASIRIDPDWHRHLAPDGLGTALAQASRAAVSARTSALTGALDGPDRMGSFERIRSYVVGHGDLPGRSDLAGRGEVARHGPRPEPRAPDRPPPPHDPVPPRPASAVVADVLRVLNTVPDPVPEPTAPPEATGSAASGRLVLTIAPDGTLSGRISAEWLARQEPAELVAALDTALRAARAAHAAANPAAADTAWLDGLIGEALAVLADPRHFTIDRGDGG